MTIHQKLSAGSVGSSIALLAFFPQGFATSIAVIASIALYGFTIFLERREDERLVRIEARIKELDDRLQNLTVAKSFNR